MELRSTIQRGEIREKKNREQKIKRLTGREKVN